jgi:pimeloyl-ACP methyl ester carboxylesterase
MDCRAREFQRIYCGSMTPEVGAPPAAGRIRGMTDQAPITGMLDVPGARLYYERRGTGPLLLVIGSPMDSAGFAGLAGALADRYTVVTYDPRGIANSSRENTTEDITPEQQADDVHRLLAALDAGPAHYFGSSGGAVVGLALVTAHPESVRTLVAHEPPLVELLPDRVERRADIEDIYQTYLAKGQDAAMQKFMSHLGLAPAAGDEHEAPQWQPSDEELARMRATTDVMLGHIIRQSTGYQPDVAALAAASTRIVVGVGAGSKGQLANRTALALADRLGTPVVEFPGDHGGFVFHPQEFAAVLDRVIGST